MNCTDSKPLISTYLDGELSEELAGRLRKHLLACQPCRGAAQEVKSLRGWFLRSEAPAVPGDFAARVARRAFAGDTGERDVVLTPVAPRGAIASREAPALRFVLRATAAAAAVLFVVALAIGTRRQPEGDSLSASEPVEHMSTERILQEFDQLEATEGVARPVADSQPDASGDSAAER